jgi:hypothetical protein
MVAAKGKGRISKSQRNGKLTVQGMSLEDLVRAAVHTPPEVTTTQPGHGGLKEPEQEQRVKPLR